MLDDGWRRRPGAAFIDNLQVKTLAPRGLADRFKRVCDGVGIVHGLAFGERQVRALHEVDIGSET